MSETVIYTGRKSLVAYIGFIFGQAFFIAIVNAIFYGASYAMGEAEAPASAFRYLSLAWTGINIYLALSFIYQLFWMRSIQWIITDEGVRIKRGLLPWRKIDFMHPYESIFEAYYDFGFFAKLFGYGGCNLRRTEGVTTEIHETRMHNAARIIGLINEHLKKLRKEAKGAIISPAKSDAEELSHLAKLKENGDISAKEFEIMKQKIIER